MFAVGLSGDEAKGAVEAPFALRVFGEEAQQQSRAERDEQRRLISAAEAMQQLMKQLEIGDIDEDVEVIVSALRGDTADLKVIELDLHSIARHRLELIEHHRVLRVEIGKVRT